MNAYRAKTVLSSFLKGYEIDRELLTEAITVESLPKIEQATSFFDTAYKTTAYIERFEPDANKKWVALDDLLRVFKR